MQVFSIIVNGCILSWGTTCNKKIYINRPIHYDCVSVFITLVECDLTKARFTLALNNVATQSEDLLAWYNVTLALSLATTPWVTKVRYAIPLFSLRYFCKCEPGFAFD